jgi:cardiolipin synthase
MHILTRAVLHSFFLLSISSCTELPDTDSLIERRKGQIVRFENASGPVFAERSAAILAELKRKSGNIDILEKQIALEQAIVVSPLVIDNKVTLLEDGKATYAAMLAAIQKATNHINIESYIIDDDEIGQQFARQLQAQQARGVQVNLIYDSVGGMNTPKAFYEELREDGIAVLEFNPINPLEAKAPWNINNRDHRKLLVVDGRIAFLGGINISSVYSSGSMVKRAGASSHSSVAWRDTHLQIEGPVVAEFQKMFLQTWEKQHGTALAAKDYFPTLRAQGNDVVRAIGSTPDDPFSLIYLTLISAINNAERQVYLTSAYFVPDTQLLKALSDAVGRGVDVKLIVPSHSDSELAFYAGRVHFTHLLNNGVKIYERQGELLHAKTAVIDGVWSTVGSTNLDWRSFLDNDEVNAVIIGREFAAKMAAMFAQDLALSKSLDTESWSNRSLLMRLKELMAQLWSRLL